METDHIIVIVVLGGIFAAVGGGVLVVLSMAGHAKVVITVKKIRQGTKYEPKLRRQWGWNPRLGGERDYQRNPIVDDGRDVNTYQLDTDRGEFAVGKDIYEQVDEGRSYNMQVRTFRNKMIAIESVLDVVKDK